MRSSTLLLSAAMIFGVAAQTCALADDYRGTFEQQMACTPDVWRLCSDAIPDTNRIVACLRSNVPQLSAGCRAVFGANNSADPPGRAPRGRPPENGDAAQPRPRDNGWFR